VERKRWMVAACVLLFFFMFSPVLFAQEVKFQLNKGHGMKEILASYEGKRVAVRLDSGEEVEGIVTPLETNWFISQSSQRGFL